MCIACCTRSKPLLYRMNNKVLCFNCALSAGLVMYCRRLSFCRKSRLSLIRSAIVSREWYGAALGVKPGRHGRQRLPAKRLLMLAGCYRCVHCVLPDSSFCNEHCRNSGRIVWRPTVQLCETITENECRSGAGSTSILTFPGPEHALPVPTHSN